MNNAFTIIFLQLVICTGLSRLFSEYLMSHVTLLEKDIRMWKEQSILFQKKNHILKRQAQLNNLGQTLLFSWKVVGKNVQATIPTGNMRYDKDTVPENQAVEPTFVASFSARKLTPMANIRAILSNFFLPPTRHFGIVAYTSSNNLSRNCCMQRTHTQAPIWKAFEQKTRQLYLIYPFPWRQKLGKS